MGMRQKEWARKARQELMNILGGCCATCKTTKDLEFDCILNRGDRHHKLDTSARMSFYRAEHMRGNLQILCRLHNNIKSSNEFGLYYPIHTTATLNNEPF